MHVKELNLVFSYDYSVSSGHYTAYAFSPKSGEYLSKVEEV